MDAARLRGDSSVASDTQEYRSRQWHGRIQSQQGALKDGWKGLFRFVLRDDVMGQRN